MYTVKRFIILLLVFIEVSTAHATSTIMKNLTPQEVEKKALNGDVQAQKKMLTFYMSFDNTAQSFKPYFAALFNNPDQREYALYLLVSYFFTHDEDHMIEEYIDIIGKTYIKEPTINIAKYFMTLICLNGQPQDSTLIFKQIDDVVDVRNKALYGSCLARYTSKEDISIRNYGLEILMQESLAGSPLALGQLGEDLYYRQNNTKEAIKYLEKADQKENPDAAQLLFRIYAFDNKYKDVGNAKLYAQKGYNIKNSGEITNIKIEDKKATINYASKTVQILTLHENNSVSSMTISSKKKEPSLEINQSP